MTERKKIRIPNDWQETEIGAQIAQRIDSQIPMCSWHRLLIVAKVPKELQTSYIITDDLTKATRQHEWVVLEKNQMEANLFEPGEGIFY